MVILYIAISLLLVYSALIFYYWLSWRSIPDYVPPLKKPLTKFSVIIPARNEEKNIITCLLSVCQQDYPSELLQIIAIDDGSTDRTWELLGHFYYEGREINCSRLTDIKDGGFSAYKKRAIQTGIVIS